MKTKVKKEVLRAIVVYVSVLLFFGVFLCYEAFRAFHVEDYQITALQFDVSKPTYYVELSGERLDVPSVQPSDECRHCVMYDGLEVTCLRLAGEKYVYVLSGTLSVDEVLEEVRRDLRAVPALGFTIVLIFGGMFLWNFCKSVQ